MLHDEVPVERDRADFVLVGYVLRRFSQRESFDELMVDCFENLLMQRLSQLRLHLVYACHDLLSLISFYKLGCNG